MNKDEFGYLGECLSSFSEQSSELSYFIRESCIETFCMKVLMEGWQVREVSETKKPISTGYLHGYLVSIRKEELNGKS